MEFKFEEFMNSYPELRKLSAEKQAEIKAKWLKFAPGAEQQAIGWKRRAGAEAFLKLLKPEYKKELEKEISSLHLIKNEARFRVQILRLLGQVLYGGVFYEMTSEYTKRRVKGPRKAAGGRTIGGDTNRKI
jgi:hypothetical protein